MLSGSYPFGIQQGDNLDTVGEKVQKQEKDLEFNHPSFHGVSEEAKAFIVECLNRDKGDRMVTEDLLLHDFINKEELFSQATSQEVSEAIMNLKRFATASKF